MYDPKSMKAEEFISHEEIEATLRYADENCNNRPLIREILDKAKECKGLSHQEASVLLACEIPEVIEEIYALAGEIKKKFYGNRIVMFAPLYLSNYCVNGCVYCPYHHQQRAHPAPQADAGGGRAGGRRPAGYGPQAPRDRGRRGPGEQPDRIHSRVHPDDLRHPAQNGAIRRVNVNIAATTVENYKKSRRPASAPTSCFRRRTTKRATELHPDGPEAQLLLPHRGDGPRDGGRHRRRGLRRAVRSSSSTAMNSPASSCTPSIWRLCTVSARTRSACRASRKPTTSTDKFDNGISDETFAKICA